MLDQEIAQLLPLLLDAQKGKEAVERLAQIGEPAVEPLIHWFHIMPQPPESIQWEDIPWTDYSSEALERIGKPAIRHLIQWYKTDRDKGWKPIAVAFIKSIGATEEALEFLYKEWFRFPNLAPKIQRILRGVFLHRDTREQIAEVFERAGQVKYQDVLTDMLWDDTRGIMPTAARGLGKFGDQSALKALQEFIEDYSGPREDYRWSLSPVTLARIAIDAIENRYKV